MKFDQERHELEVTLEVSGCLENRREDTGRRPWSPGGADYRPPPSFLPRCPALAPAAQWAWGHHRFTCTPGTLHFLPPKIRTLALSPVLTSCRLRLIGLPPVPVHGPFENQKGEETPAENHLTVYWSFVV